GATTNVESAVRTAFRSIEPKSVTVPLESPSRSVVHEEGSCPGPHMSFQWSCPPVAKRARASPVISALEPVSGAYQSGESIAVSAEPVGPCIEIERLPPYCVVLAPRKNVPTGALEPGHAGWPMKPHSFWPSTHWLDGSPRPSVSVTVPSISIAWP